MSHDAQRFAGQWQGLVEDLRRTTTPQGRARLGRFSIEGTRLHERALRAGARVERAVVSGRFAAAADERSRSLLRDLEQGGCTIRVAPDEVIAELTEGRSIGEVIGLVPLPPPLALRDVVQGHAERPAVLLAGVEIEDPGNVGALVRTALASGAAAFVGIGATEPYHPRAVRVSMGSIFKLPALAYDRLEPFLDDLRASGGGSLAAVAQGGTPLPRLEVDRPLLAVLLGSEAFGLPPAMRAAADGRVSIPMVSGVDSLSVNAAAAVILYEIRSRSRR